MRLHGINHSYLNTVKFNNELIRRQHPVSYNAFGYS